MLASETAIAGTLPAVVFPPAPAVTIAQHEALLKLATAMPAEFEPPLPVALEMAMARRRKSPLKMTLAEIAMARSVILLAIRRTIMPVDMTAVVIVKKNGSDGVADDNTVIRLRLPVSAMVVGDCRRARENQTQAQAGGECDTGERVRTVLFSHGHVLLVNELRALPTLG